MRWHHALFLHWPVQPGWVRRRLPRNLPLDVFEGHAWLTISPHRITHLRPRCTVALPGLSSLVEVNVRTYVDLNGKPGVWFFSLDANHWPAVAAARRLFALPYFTASASYESVDGRLHFHSERSDCTAPPARFTGSFRPTEVPAHPTTLGSLDHWLLERYCFYSLDERDRLFRTDIHHQPWQVQRAEALIQENTLTTPLDIALSGQPLAHFAKHQDMVAWLPQRLTSGIKV